MLTVTLGSATPAPPSDVSDLIQTFQAALARKDLSEAVRSAAKLHSAIQLQYRSYLTRDAEDRVGEALKWLPIDVETMLVQQEPTVVNRSGDSQLAFIDKPELLYTMSKLRSVGNGDLSKSLKDGMVRLAVVGMRNMRGGGGGIPGPMPEADAAYIYFLAQPVEAAAFGSPSATTTAGHPLWKGLATRGTDQPEPSGMRPDAPQTVETWFALLRSDVLVLATTREFLIDVLGRAETHGSERALPQTLPEWAYVDRKALFWGIRHYAHPGSSGDVTNPLNSVEQRPPDDEQAVGITMAFDADRNLLDVRYLSGNQTFPPRAFIQAEDQFVMGDFRKGVSQWKANIQERGAFPLQFSLHLLGFGLYP